MAKFDQKQHVLLINGVEIKGFADGADVISFAENNEAGALTVGADGEGVFVANQNRSGTLTIKLLQHGESVAFLNNLRRQQRDSLKSFTPLTLSVRDLINEDRITASQGYFTTAPGYVRGNANNDTQFVIVFAKTEVVLEAGA